MTNFNTNMTEQYVQNLYRKNAENAKKAYESNQGKKQRDSAKKETQYNDEAAVYEGSVAPEQKTGAYSRPVSVNSNKKNDLQAKLEETYANLSDAAKDYLEELKAKFGDIDFFIADCATDEEMNRYFAMGTKKYSCVISSATLEQMATDEEARVKYEGIIDGADEKLEEVRQEVKEELGEETAEQIESFAISIDDNGVVTYFAKLKESNDAYYEKLKEKRAEEKAEDKKAEKKEPALIKAESKEALLEALREVLGIPMTDPEVAVGEPESKEEETKKE
ncbi:MAG: hypothetical protein E7260_09845 [Lachnospiraceae bacterium]|nr:hypothetical protein [Lachnospiraceae bacterium]